MLFGTIPSDYIDKINSSSKEIIDEIVNHMEDIKKLTDIDEYLHKNKR